MFRLYRGREGNPLKKAVKASGAPIPNAINQESKLDGIESILNCQVLGKLVTVRVLTMPDESPEYDGPQHTQKKNIAGQHHADAQ